MVHMTEDSSGQNVEKSDTRSGKQLAAESFLDRHLGNGIHLFLSLLAILILVAAAIATVEIVIRDFPRLWQQASEYDAMHQIIQNILLVAIAAELALLLLFHRTSAAVEVLIFVIARKMVTPGISGFELLLGTAALAGLIIVRFYYLSDRRAGGVVARS
jgi:hypothetical protein